MLGIQAKLKLVKFYRNFSRYNFEKLIRTMIEYIPLTYDLNGFKSRINRHLLTVGSF